MFDYLEQNGIVSRALDAVDAEKAEREMKALPEKVFREAVREAWLAVFREECMQAIAAKCGCPSSDPIHLDLPLLGVMLVGILIGDERGIKRPGRSAYRKIQRELLNVAVECKAVREGKLTSINRA